MTERVLITGIRGQTGSYLAEHLADRFEVHGTSRTASEVVTESATGEAAVHRVDLTDAAAVRGVIARVQPSRVFHLAAASAVTSQDETDPATDHLLAALPDGARLVFASSREVFDPTVPGPHSERTPIGNHRSAYARRKASSQAAVAAARKAGRWASSAILFNHESPRRPERFVTRKITAAAARIAAGDRSPLVLGNLQTARDWGWAPDFARAMALMAEAEQPRDHVVATGRLHTLADLLAAAFGCLGLDWTGHVEQDPELLRRHDTPGVAGDATRIWQSLGWHPTVPFDEIVERMVRADQERIRSS